ncbi:MAG: sulfurtransferase-like selenium metabolism protein YedF [Spirochaetae bacterium HGW-Spirochaetae-1]|jgi:selenium metabolism protein YedF|nr:MAG: sulfurtransferase-like selenium metabolism protein YedF [Spirochaetae bacterium HGW-Spirochaetae-1]
MSFQVDARGLACPQPVINTKKALEKHDSLTVIVDNETARENVKRLLSSLGCSFNIAEKPDGIYISAEKGETAVAEKSPAPGEAVSGPPVVVISEDVMGRGDRELGAILMRSFMHTVTEIDNRPGILIFFNTGVKLTVKDSPVVADIKALEESGVRVLVCGTCLNFFGITDQLGAGIVSNMYDIAEAMTGSGKVISV